MLSNFGKPVGLPIPASLTKPQYQIYHYKLSYYQRRRKVLRYGGQAVIEGHLLEQANFSKMRDLNDCPQFSLTTSKAFDILRGLLQSPSQALLLRAQFCQPLLQIRPLFTYWALICLLLGPSTEFKPGPSIQGSATRAFYKS